MGDRRFGSSTGATHIQGHSPPLGGRRARRPSALTPHTARTVSCAGPMAIVRPRPASPPPPPLPPPRHVKDIEMGVDLGWQFSNHGRLAVTTVPALPHADHTTYPTSFRRSSGDGDDLPLPPPDVIMHGRGEPLTNDVPDEGYGSLSGSSYSAQLHSDGHLEQQRKTSAHAYDQRLLSRLPKTPTHPSGGDSAEASPTSRRASVPSPHAPAMRNLSLSERSLSVSTEPFPKLNSPLGNKWPHSPRSQTSLLSPAPTSALSIPSLGDTYPSPREEQPPTIRRTEEPERIGRRVPVSATLAKHSESNLSRAMHDAQTRAGGNVGGGRHANMQAGSGGGSGSGGGNGSGDNIAALRHQAGSAKTSPKPRGPSSAQAPGVSWGWTSDPLTTSGQPPPIATAPATTCTPIAGSSATDTRYLGFADHLHLHPPSPSPSHHHHPHPPRLAHPSSPAYPPSGYGVVEISTQPHPYAQLPSRERPRSPSRPVMANEKENLKRKHPDTDTAVAGNDPSDRVSTARKSNHSTSPGLSAHAPQRGVTAPYALGDGANNTLATSLDPLTAAAMANAAASDASLLAIDPGLRAATGTMGTSAPNLAAIAAQASSATAPSVAGTEEFSHIPQNTATRMPPSANICDCCPKKPKRFDTLEELQQHQNEKQYECRWCHNRFKNKNEAERHQNSLHLRRQSWSCAVLDRNIRAAFHPCTAIPPNTGGGQQQPPATAPYAEFDVCGYCGTQFPNEPAADWMARSQHLTNAHKFGECNQTKKFYRADHFRQHLKHSHSGQSGKWTNMLEAACMRDEPPPTPEAQKVDGQHLAPASAGSAGAGSHAGGAAAAGAPPHVPHPQQPVTAQQLQAQAQQAAAHALIEHKNRVSQGGMGPPAMSMEQARALALAGAGATAPMAMMSSGQHDYAGVNPAHDPSLGFTADDHAKPDMP